MRKRPEKGWRDEVPLKDQTTATFRGEITAADILRARDELRLRPYQKEVLDFVVRKKVIPPLVWRGRSTFVGIDMGAKDGDKSVTIGMKADKKGRLYPVYYDEFGTFPTYKWYKNPIEWWKWRQLTRRWKKSSKFFEYRSTPRHKNPWKN